MHAAPLPLRRRPPPPPPPHYHQPLSIKPPPPPSLPHTQSVALTAGAPGLGARMSLDLGQTMNMRNFKDLGEVSMGITHCQHTLAAPSCHSCYHSTVLGCQTGTIYAQSIGAANDWQNQQICSFLPRPLSHGSATCQSQNGILIMIAMNPSSMFLAVLCR